MSDVLFKIFGAAILCVTVGTVLKRSNPDGATLLRAVGGVVLAAAVISTVSPIIEYVYGLSELFEGGDDVIGVLLRALGIAVLTHICSTVCRDCGEGSIAAYAELGGKIEILLLSLPLLRDIVDAVIKLADI